MPEELRAIEHRSSSDIVKRWFAGELNSTVAECDELYGDGIAPNGRVGSGLGGVVLDFRAE